MRGHNLWHAVVLAAPALAVFLCLVVYPALEGILLSLFPLDVVSWASDGSALGAHSGSFAGLESYRGLFANRSFVDSVKVMLAFTVVTTILELGFALAVALAFEYVIKLPGLVKTLLLVPMFVIPLVSGLTFRYLFDPLDGAAAEILRLFGREAPDLFSSGAGAFGLVVWQDFWRMWPFVFLILAAGLKTIPKDLLEAFEIDGGSLAGAVRHIVIPLLVPSLLVAGGLKAVESLKAFTEIYTLTGGGPGTATTTLSLFIVREGFESFRVSSAAAAGTLLLALGLTLAAGYTSWQVFRMRRWGGHQA